MADRSDLHVLLDSLPPDVAERIRALLPPAFRLTAARARLDRLRGRLRLASLATGAWRGTNISGEEIRIGMKADAVAFENSRVELHVDVELGFQVPNIRSKEPKVFKLGPVHESVATPTLPRLNLSSLAREIAASFVLSSVHADEVTADVAPIENVDAGVAEVESIDVEGFVAPTGGIGLAGMVLEPVGFRRAGIDGGTVARSQTARVGLEGEAKAPDVVLRGATITGGRAQAAEGGDLNLGFEVQLPALTIKTFPAMPAAIERLVTRLSLRMEPKVVFQIGNLRLEGLSLSTSVGSLRIGALSVPVNVTGATLDDIEFSGAEAREVEVRQDEAAKRPERVATGVGSHESHLDAGLDDGTAEAEADPASEGE